MNALVESTTYFGYKDTFLIVHYNKRIQSQSTPSGAVIVATVHILHQTPLFLGKLKCLKCWFGIPNELAIVFSIGLKSLKNENEFQVWFLPRFRWKHLAFNLFKLNIF